MENTLLFKAVCLFVFLSIVLVGYIEKVPM